MPIKFNPVGRPTASELCSFAPVTLMPC